MGASLNIIDTEMRTSVKSNKIQTKNETAKIQFDINDGDVEMAKVEDS